MFTRANGRIRFRPTRITLQPTALVHEAYVRVIGGEDPGWNSRGHFFAAAAHPMRRILVDQYRRKQRLRHGGGRNRELLDEQKLAIESPQDDLVAIDEALNELERKDGRKAQIGNLRYFVGLTVAEVADALNISVSTVKREWRFHLQRLQKTHESAEHFLTSADLYHSCWTSTNSDHFQVQRASALLVRYRRGENRISQKPTWFSCEKPATTAWIMGVLLDKFPNGLSK